MKLLLFGGVLASTAAAVAVPTDSVPVFEKDVLPIFSTYCFTCHGKSSPELGVDLRTARSVMRGGFNGPVIHKGSAEESRLFQKVSNAEMPPPAFNSKVPEAQVETIRRWIEGGAPSEAKHEIPEAARQQIARFKNDIQPLLNERCVACHGGDRPQSGLDLSTLASVLRGGVHGPVVIEGFSEKSVLIRQLVSGVMPPEGAAQALSTDEVEVIRSWIDEGSFADYVDLGNPLDRALTEAEAPPITRKDREYWAFRTPIAGPVPDVDSLERVQGPIDSFVLHKLEGEGLSMSAPASKRTLMRRAFLDLWGLPPTPEEAAAFLDDEAPGAFERLLDRLLESPKYGQRWGRFWLDAAGYVDTTGKDFRAENPILAPGMWRYRDYVIDSFNRDKPWDQFLTEQLAGDEMHDWRNAASYSPEMLEGLIATGYLRTVLDATDEDISDRPSDRYDTLFALIDKVARSSIGLTLSCARCHSHKFDPIPQRDYYRFLALLSSAYNPSKWIQPKNRVLYTVSATEKEKIDHHNEEVDAELEELMASVEVIRKPYAEQLVEEKLETVPEVLREDLRAALATDATERTEVQKYLVSKFGPSVEVTDKEIDSRVSASDGEELSRLEQDLKAWRGYRHELHKLRALWDGDELPVIRLLQRGSVENPGPAVKPGFLEILCKEGDDCLASPSPNRVGKTMGYRLALAEWMTDPEHPLTARVVVNRIWQHHFGTGIVSTPDNFGRYGAPPSHPELLDWLAVDFVNHGWRVKRLHKLIMLSSVYQQSSRRTDNPSADRAHVKDPGNRLLWRRPLRRLEAEALRDSILSVADRLDLTANGPPVMLDPRSDGLQLPVVEGGNRRSVYILARRTWSSTFMTTFDFPNIDTSCTNRVPSATPLQSLTMMNSDFVTENATALARRAMQRAKGSANGTESIIRAGYGIVLSREPTPKEIELAAGHLEREQALFARANSSDDEALERSVESFAQMLLSSNEFLYVD